MLELPSPCLVVLVGPAGSGKTQWANEYFSGRVIGSDALRALAGEGEDDLRASVDAFALLDEVVERRMRRRLTTVVDTLGTDAGRRQRWRAMAAKHDVPCHVVVFATPSADIRRWNKARAKRVPEAVLRAQLAEFQVVVETIRGEPFDDVHEVTPDVVPLQVAPSLTRPAAAEAARPGVESTQRRLTFGLQVPKFTWPGGPSEIGPRLRAGSLERAEAAGFDALYVMDHFRQIPMFGPPWLDMLESWTTLSHLAGCTETIRLGTMVSGITHRSVPLLAKIVATLDVLSGGRAICGLGVGWYEDEHRAYGWRFPPVAERYALLEDALELLPMMWGPGGKPFDGRVLHVPDTSCYPRPLQERIPIMIGGSGERRTLRLVASGADACSLFGEPDVVRRKVAVLAGHCEAVGRDPATVSVSHLSTVLVGDDAGHVRQLVEATRPPKVSAERHARAVNAGTVEQHVTRVGRFIDAGVDHVVVSLADAADADAVDRFGWVVTAARAPRTVTTVEAIDQARSAIDAINAADTNQHEGEPLAQLQGRLAEDWVIRLDPDASAALRLAARAHHLRRWVVPRSSYPEGRAGYLQWRRDQKQRHAAELRELLESAGVDETVVARASAIVAKVGLGSDPEVQVFEDAVCLTFLQTQLGETADRLDEAHMTNVIAKTLTKMSESGKAAALTIDLDARGRALLARALGD